jgi:hypothetical protein
VTRWLGLCLALALAACGIKGEPSAPEPAAAETDSLGGSNRSDAPVPVDNSVVNTLYQ